MVWLSNRIREPSKIPTFFYLMDFWHGKGTWYKETMIAGCVLLYQSPYTMSPTSNLSLLFSTSPSDCSNTSFSIETIAIPTSCIIFHIYWNTISWYAVLKIAFLRPQTSYMRFFQQTRATLYCWKNKKIVKLVLENGYL